MPKVTLEFNLPEDKEDLKLAQAGPDYYSFLCEYANYLRTKAKHTTPTMITTWEEVREEFWRIANEHEVSIL